jgi:chromosome segregation ATPase
MLKSLHSRLQSLIENLGYTIKKDDHPIDHIGYVLTKDEEAKQSYIEYLDAKRQVEKEMEEEVVKYERKLEELGREIQGIKERIRDNGTDDRGEETKTSTIRDGFKNLRRRIQDDYNSNRWPEARIQPTFSESRETQNYFNSILQHSSQKSGEIRRWDTEDIERYYQWKQKVEVIKKLFLREKYILEKIQNAIEQEQGEIRAINIIIRQNIQEIQDIRTRQEQEPDPDNQRPKPRWGI